MSLLEHGFVVAVVAILEVSVQVEMLIKFGDSKIYVLLSKFILSHYVLHQFMHLI